MTELNLRELSKAVSHALRHEPWLYELELDAQGWTPVSALLDALAVERDEWVNLRTSDLEDMIRTSDKPRHEISNDRIRARYGHSLASRVELEQAAPPPILYHGTSRAFAERIRAEGLRPMNRQYVHLSANEEIAHAVGRRKDKHPLLFVVDAAGAASDGIAFYRADDLIWLADQVLGKYLRDLNNTER